ncbi:MAG: DNA-processing protein DprA [Armatimonadota bacterium]|nr:DNA-processing protein DprA [bacterium]MCS7309930.1 DNA-processing protein DprA [Armatimonadota bacterium]MDW8105232.1 DNA-processing protein DprA [Armatimonadota bacterium]MDW8289948.1 DNA-processing protein DprA [Armatimonadota bacterium]
MEGARLRALLRLAYLELPPRRLRLLLEHYHEPEAIFSASRQELLRLEGMTEAVAARILNAPELTPKQWQRWQQAEARLLTWRDDGYPPPLREIEDFPPLLFVRGSLQERDRFAIAIVGTRRPTPYGRSIAERLARELSRYGLTVVSGGARGIDTAAHTGALRAGGRTLAVLGCGIDVAYPADSAALFQRISTQGAVLSEYPPGITPDAWRFPARNRLVSALALGVLVVEAPNDSGALITATHALEQGKPVFAVPGNIDTGHSAGCHQLIKDGATLVDSVEDVVCGLGIAPEPPPERTAPVPSLTPMQQQLLQSLSLTPKHVDTLADELGMPVAQLNAELLLLEMHNLVRRQPGNTYVRVL